MKNNKVYLMVGAFVLCGTALLIGIWLWFSASNRQAYDIYRIVFHEPVDGLTTNSIVKYNGVEVGRVKEIHLDKADPSSIFVYINILQGTPIAISTYATIKPQGVTGMSFINLGLNRSKKFIVIEPHNSDPYPTIVAQPSLLYSLTEQAQSVTGNIKDISLQIKAALNDKNMAHLSHIVANLDQATTAVAKQSNNIEHSLGLINQVLINFKDNTQHFNRALIQFNSLAQALHSNSNKLDQVLDTLQNDTLRNINSVFLPSLNDTITNMSKTSAQADELMRTINHTPSILVRGKVPAAAGPGE
jgi:phospholipid/cholesterol/gamma-HCH transport system substrate-binding protein